MSARQYITRSPRYVFQAEESNLVRFAPLQTRGISQKAVIQTLSESGLSFTLPITEAIESLPEEGSPLKVEFPIPGRSTIACFATVTRVEQRHEWIPEWGDRGYHLVALQFRHLPSLHLRAIQKGLSGLVDQESNFDWQQVKRTHAFAFGGMSLCVVACSFALTLSAEAWSRFLGL